MLYYRKTREIVQNLTLAFSNTGDAPRKMAMTGEKAGKEPQLHSEEAHTEPKEGLKTENKPVWCNSSDYNTPVVWQNIFKKLDQKDEATFSRSCTEWNDLVCSKRTMFLFPEVAPILIGVLPQNALLQCRQVSQSWTQELARQYQDHPVRLILPFEIANWGKRNAKLINYFHSSVAIQKFLEDMGEHPGNPFPGGNVLFEWIPSQPMIPDEYHCARIDFWENALQLCQRFGEHIYYVRFTFDHGTVTRGIARLFRDCLVHVPNLKRLSIRNGYYGHADQMRDYFRQFPLPRLQNLEMFDTQHACRALVAFVLDSCAIPGNIKRLFLQTTETSNFELPEMVFSFVNLEVLQAPFFIHDLQRLGNLERVQPLREIHFSWQHVPMQLQELFGALEPLSNSLIHLEAPVSMRDSAEWSSTAINLPNLRKLYLNGFYGSMDPFVQLTSLTNLSISFYDLLYYTAGVSRVDFFGFEHRMQDSNIWSLIPSLQILNIGSSKFKRHIIRPISQNEG